MEAPLCKGGWQREALTEGLLRYGRLQPLHRTLCGPPPLAQGRLCLT